ncbi:hypothetical protein BS78_10G004200 [Paspalum vaginatum]|nr:hypothetical protein BS78_10G004200 [Paspalum vaginatum]
MDGRFSAPRSPARRRSAWRQLHLATPGQPRLAGVPVSPSNLPVTCHSGVYTHSQPQCGPFCSGGEGSSARAERLQLSGSLMSASDDGSDVGDVAASSLQGRSLPHCSADIVCATVL